MLLLRLPRPSQTNLTLTVQNLPIVISKATPLGFPPRPENASNWFLTTFSSLNRRRHHLPPFSCENGCTELHQDCCTDNPTQHCVCDEGRGAGPVEQYHPSSPGTIGPRVEALDRAKSMFMMQAMNGADRGKKEFRELVVEGCGPGLTVQEVVQCLGFDHSPKRRRYRTNI